MQCPVCGSYNDDDAKFCGECGADLHAPAPQPSPEAQTVAEPAPAPKREIVWNVPQKPEPQPAQQPQWGYAAEQQTPQWGYAPAQPAPRIPQPQPIPQPAPQPVFQAAPQPQPVPAPQPQIPQPQPLPAPQPQMPQRELEAPAFEAAASSAYSGKRSLYPFEIASYIIIGVWIILFIVENSRAYRRTRWIEDYAQYIILASGLIPALLSLIPPSAEAKGKPSPGAAGVLLALLIPLTAIGVLCIAGVMIEPINPSVNSCLVVFGFSMILLLVQDIRRIRRA